MIITGIAHEPKKLRERSFLPSLEMITMARRLLRTYQATGVVTSLTPGWEFALAKAAQELRIPYTVAIPYAGREAEWPGELRLPYLDMVARANEVFRISECPGLEAVVEADCWRVDTSDMLLALWDCGFEGEVFCTIDYALKTGKLVANHWQDWNTIAGLRRPARVTRVVTATAGAPVFEQRPSKNNRPV